MAPKKRSHRSRPIAADSSRSASSAATSQQPPTTRTRPDWRWRTFPVFAAFATGLLVAFLVNEGSANPVAFVVQIAALLGVGYSLAHLVVSNVVRAGRTTRGHRNEDTEDVVVYPNEEPPAV